MSEKQTRLQAYKKELQSINEYLQAKPLPRSGFLKKFVTAAKERKRVLELNILFIENPTQYYNHKRALENFIFHN